MLRELEFIDDETDSHGILFVKIDDLEVAKRFGIDPNEIPSLVYFESRIPNFYAGDLMKEVRDDTTLTNLDSSRHEKMKRAKVQPAPHATRPRPLHNRSSVFIGRRARLAHPSKVHG